MDAPNFATEYPPYHRSRRRRRHEAKGSPHGCDASADSAPAAHREFASARTNAVKSLVSTLAIALLAAAATAPASITAFTTAPRSARTIKYDARRDRVPRGISIFLDGRSSRSGIRFAAVANTDDGDYSDDEDDEDDEDGSEMPPPAVDGFDFEDDAVLSMPTRDELESMTVAQLKQQLRLRGRGVTGNKALLVERLSETGGTAGSADDLRPGYSRYEKPPPTSKRPDATVGDEGESSEEGAEAEDAGRVAEDAVRVTEARARGADIADVTDFIDAEEVGRSFRSSDRGGERVVDDDVAGGEGDATEEEAGEDASSSSSPEVWGEDARIVDDYEGRSVVVDGLSRTVVEFKGCDDATVRAYVVGSRDSLKSFLRGGDRAGGDDADDRPEERDAPAHSSMEEEVYATQRKREEEASRGLIRPDEAEGQEDAADPGTPYSTVERDFGDWGVYTPTGAQLSSTEVQGVLLLSDVHGPFAPDVRALADKIAFECQPVVVLVPDMFRGNPWTPAANATAKDEDGVERNQDGRTYEEWRATHPGQRVDVDVRAAAAVLRRQYAVSSVAVWGTCYGGGRALEAAAGWYEGGPESYYDDAMGSRPPPPHVDPVAAVAWYPTRYDAARLFGRENEGFRTLEGGGDRRVAVMAVFGGDDVLPGATPRDAALLKERLDDDPRVVDSMVKVFPGRGHGFAHAGLGAGAVEDGDGDGSARFAGEDYGAAPPAGVGGDAEVACLLSTAFMEAYTRVFLPTVGAPVRSGPDGRWSALEMDDGRGGGDARAALEGAIDGHEDDFDVDFRRMPRSRGPSLEGPGGEAFDEVEDEREGMRRRILEKYDIREDDDEETFDRKFERAREDGALDGLMLDAYVDDSGDAYW